MEQSPRNTVLGPPAIQTHLFASGTKRSCKSIRVSRCKNLSHGTAYGILRHVETTCRDNQRLFLCHLQRGTSDLSEELKSVFRGYCLIPK